MDILLQCLCAFILWTSVACFKARNATDMERVHTDILQGYVIVSPVQYAYETVLVDLSFKMMQIKTLDCKRQVLETSGMLYMVWYDERLSWNPEEYGGIYYVTIDARKVWVPLIGLQNSVDGVADVNMRILFPVLVLSNGKVHWTYSGDFSSSCVIDMQAFPYDEQNCSLRFGNIIESEVMVNITTSQTEADMKYFIPSSEFHVKRAGIGRESTEGMNVDDYPSNLSMVQFWFCFKRKPRYYVLNIIVPTVVLSLLSALTFVVPVDSGEKLSIGISILLAFSVFMLLLSDITPQSSDKSPLLGIYLTSVMAISGFNMFCQMAILNMYYIEPLRPVPNWLQAVERAFTRCFYCKSSGRACPKRAEHEIYTNAKEHLQEMLLSVINIDDSVPAGENDKNLGLRILVHELRTITDSVRYEEETSSTKSEWKYVGRMFDRVFFLFFMFVQLVMITAMFVILPEM